MGQWSGNDNTTDPIGRTGDVGIGTTPGEKLEVYGNIKLTDYGNGRVWTTEKVYNVLDYGAYNDNSHSSETKTAVQNAINDAGNGGIVYLPAGTYKISSSLFLDSNVRLKGAGPSATTINADFTGSTVIEIQDSAQLKYASVVDLKITSTDNTHSNKGLSLNNSVYCYFENVSIFKMQYGIRGTNQCGINTFVNMHIEDCATGVRLGETGEANWGNANTFVGGLIDGCIDYGIHVLWGWGNSFYGLTVQACGMAGIYFDNQSFSQTLGNNLVSGCYIEVNGSTGDHPCQIRINCKGNHIIGNHLVRNNSGSGSGIYVYWESYSSSYDGNIYFGNAESITDTNWTYNEVLLSNVGIATTTPAYPLQIGSIWNNLGSNYKCAIGGDLAVGGDTTSSAHIRISEGTSGTFLELYRNSSSSQIYSSNASALLLQPSGGSVGIGTTSPSNKLDIVSTGSTKVLIHANDSNNDRYPEIEIKAGNTDAGAYSVLKFSKTAGESATEKLNIQNGSSSNLVSILGSGNVGIGETSPDRRLHVTDSNKQVARIESTAVSNLAVDLCVNNGSPNGSVTALRGSLCVDVSNATLYINNSGTNPGDSGTSWVTV